MIKDEEILTLLQYSDSFFPSGAVSFSWGLEMLKNDNVITSKVELEKFIEIQLLERWAPFDRVILAHTYDCSEDLANVCSIDRLVECMSLATEVRNGSKRLGIALISTFEKLNYQSARQYRSKIDKGQAYGHLSVTQAYIWKSLDLSKNSVLIMSAYTFCVSVLGAALRLGLVGHIDCQNSLIKIRKLIIELIKWHIPELEEIYAFTPFTEIASMRHENADIRLFAN